MDSKKRSIILIVDDDLLIRDALGNYVGRVFPNNEIIFASDGSEAWAIIKEKGSEIAILITDWRMPCMDGMELIKKTKEMWDNEITTVMISGIFKPEGFIGDFFLNKLFNRKELLEIIGDNL